MTQADLKVLSGKQAGTIIPLPEGKFLIGREEDCHLRPNSDLVSRHHCVFTVDEYAIRVRDLGSTNGTLVNGERIRGGVMLNPGDVVSIGKIEFEVVIRSPSQDSQDTDTHMAFNTDTQMSPAAGMPTVVADEDQPLMDDSQADTGAEIPATPAPQADTQFAHPAAGHPQQPMVGYPGMPQMGYPPMMPPPYGYPAYPGMYQQPMGYPPMPGAYPQPPMPAPEEPPSSSSQQQVAPVKLPDPSETGVKPPEAPSPSGEPQTAAAKSKAEAPSKAADIIQKYRNRRPTSGG